MEERGRGRILAAVMAGIAAFTGWLLLRPEKYSPPVPSDPNSSQNMAPDNAVPATAELSLVSEEEKRPGDVIERVEYINPADLTKTEVLFTYNSTIMCSPSIKFETEGPQSQHKYSVSYCVGSYGRGMWNNEEHFPRPDRMIVFLEDMNLKFIAAENGQLNMVTIEGKEVSVFSAVLDAASRWRSNLATARYNLDQIIENKEPGKYFDYMGVVTSCSVEADKAWVTAFEHARGFPVYPTAYKHPVGKVNRLRTYQDNFIKLEVDLIQLTPKQAIGTGR